MIRTDGATTVATRGSIIDRCDVSIAREGSLFLVYPVSTAAKDWIIENVDWDEANWWGGALVVEHRYISDLFDGLVDAGLRVE